MAHEARFSLENALQYNESLSESGRFKPQVRPCPINSSQEIVYSANITGDTYQNPTFLVQKAGQETQRLMNSKTNIRDQFATAMDTWPQRSNMIDNAKFGANVFKVLKAWSEAGESGPDKSIYLLCPEYDAFEQTDDHRKEQSLIKVAYLLGFQLGHATFVRQFSVERCRASCCRCANTPDDPEGGKGCKDPIGMCGRYCYHDTTEQTESDDCRLLNEEFFIENLIGINSEAITSGYKYVDYKKSEWIPSNMDEVLRKGDYDHQERMVYKSVVSFYFFYFGMDVFMLTWIHIFTGYRRTVLVIWPKVMNSKVCYVGEDGFQRVCALLSEIQTSRRTAMDDKFLEFILHGHRRKPAMDACMITKAVCRVASAWHDCILWNRAVSLGSPFGGLAVLPTSDVVEAFLKFSFSYIRPSFDMLLQDTQTNTLRFKLLDELRKHVIGCYDLEQWFTANSRMCLPSMRVPEKTEVWLHALLAARHGVQFYHDIILPQVINDVDAEFLSSLAVSIFEKIKRSDVDIFMEAVLFAGGWQYFQSSILPKIESNNLPTSISFSFAEQLHCLKNQLPRVSQYKMRLTH
ncbi:hypothetical protein ABKN59_001281 [Abortiporus biennis]